MVSYREEICKIPRFAVKNLVNVPIVLLLLTYTQNENKSISILRFTIHLKTNYIFARSVFHIFHFSSSLSYFVRCPDRILYCNFEIDVALI